MIRFVDVCKRFGAGATAVEVLRKFCLTVPSGQFCTVMGPSGAGKSTVLHLAARLTRPASGEIYLADRPLAQLSDSEAARMRRREIGFVFQFFHLVPYLSAEENVALPLVLDGCRASTIRARVQHVLRLVEMRERARHRPSELSGGELQRVAIARALVSEPRLLLADEPTGNLDSQASATIMHLLRRTHLELGVTILMVTHDPLCASYGERIVRMLDGRILEDIDVTEGAGATVPDGHRTP